MAITIYFIATSLPERLASVRDALLLKHPSDLTIEVLESALKDVESNLRSVASTSGVVPPPLFHGRGGQGAGRGGRGSGGDVASGGGGSASAGGAPRTAAGDSPAAAGGGVARVRQPPIGLPAAGGGAVAWYLNRQQQQQQQPLPSQQHSSSSSPWCGDEVGDVDRLVIHRLLGLAVEVVDVVPSVAGDMLREEVANVRAVAVSGACTADLITHLRSLNSSYRTASTDAQLALLPPPMAITIYFIATSLPERLASVRDALLLKHPSDLTIEVLESALKDIKSNLRSVASTSGVVPPPLFHRVGVAAGAARVRAEAAEAVGVTWRVAVAGVQALEERLVQRPVTPLLQLVEVSLGFVSHLLVCQLQGVEQWRGARRSQPCGRSHPPGQCFAQLTDTLVDLFRTPHAMYAVVDSSASDSVYPSVVSLGASLAEVPVACVGTCVDTSPRAALEDSSLSLTLDSRASHCFFRDRTTLTPLTTPVSVALADPTSRPVTARYTTTLPCPAVPSGPLTGFHVPSVRMLFSSL
ncbi:unnamed protein product [Closterium sp. NIES-53]